MRRAVLLAAVAAAATLAACGSTEPLRPAAGQSLPVAPYGATATPTPQDLLTPSVQARPQRSDDLLKSSDKRKPDPFDLPPR